MILALLTTPGCPPSAPRPKACASSPKPGRQHTTVLRLPFRDLLVTSTAFPSGMPPKSLPSPAPNSPKVPALAGNSSWNSRQTAPNPPPTRCSRFNLLPGRAIANDGGRKIQRLLETSFDFVSGVSG